MKFNLKWFSISFFLLIVSFNTIYSSDIEYNLLMEKSQIVQGEPIAVELVMENTLDESVWIMSDFESTGPALVEAHSKTQSINLSVMRPFNKIEQTYCLEPLRTLHVKHYITIKHKNLPTGLKKICVKGSFRIRKKCGSIMRIQYQKSLEISIKPSDKAVINSQITHLLKEIKNVPDYSKMKGKILKELSAYTDVSVIPVLVEACENKISIEIQNSLLAFDTVEADLALLSCVNSLTESFVLSYLSEKRSKIRRSQLLKKMDKSDYPIDQKIINRFKELNKSLSI